MIQSENHISLATELGSLITLHKRIEEDNFWAIFWNCWGQKSSPYNRFKCNNKNLKLLVAILLLSVESLSEESLSKIEINAEANRIKTWLENIVKQLLCSHRKINHSYYTTLVAGSTFFILNLEMRSMRLNVSPKISQLVLKLRFETRQSGSRNCVHYQYLTLPQYAFLLINTMRETQRENGERDLVIHLWFPGSHHAWNHELPDFFSQLNKQRNVSHLPVFVRSQFDS